MTVTAYLLCGLLLLAGSLVGLWLVPARQREQRPLPFPEMDGPQHPRALPPARVSRHRAEDMDSMTVNLAEEAKKFRIGD